MNKLIRMAVTGLTLCGALAFVPGVARADEDDRPPAPVVGHDRDRDRGRDHDRDGRWDRDRGRWDRDHGRWDRDHDGWRRDRDGWWRRDRDGRWWLCLDRDHDCR